MKFDNTLNVKKRSELLTLINGQEGIPSAPLARSNVTDWEIKEGDRIVITTETSLLKKGVEVEVTQIIQRSPMTQLLAGGVIIFAGEYEKEKGQDDQSRSVLGT